MFDVFDPILKPMFELVFDRYTPGMGIATLVFLMYLLGLATTHFLGRRMFSLGERALHRIPIVNAIYRAAKKQRRYFQRAYQRANTARWCSWISLGPAQVHGTGDIQDKRQGRKSLCWQSTPTSPFPTSGFLVFLPPEQVTFTDIRIDDAMKLIVSCWDSVP